MGKITKLAINRKGMALLAIGLFLSVVCAPLLLGNASIKSAEATQLREKQAIALRGELSSFPIDLTKDVTLHYGNCKTVQTVQALAKGVDIAQSGFYFGFNWPFQINFDNNSLSVSANITNSYGEVVARIINNNWKAVSPDSIEIGDRNYNAYAFEVIDISNRPIFNVEIIGPNDIRIGGIFYGPNQMVLISDNGGGIIVNPKQQDIDKFLTPIFNYPSKTKLGELVNPAYFSAYSVESTNKLADAAQSESELSTIIGYTLAFIGAFLAAVGGAIAIFHREK